MSASTAPILPVRNNHAIRAFDGVSDDLFRSITSNNQGFFCMFPTLLCKVNFCKLINMRSPHLLRTLSAITTFAGRN